MAFAGTCRFWNPIEILNLTTIRGTGVTSDSSINCGMPP